MRFSVLDANDKLVFESDCVIDACYHLRTSGIGKGRAIRNNPDGSTTDIAIKDNKYHDTDDSLGG